jgi:protein-tyrosine phosphatase
MKDLHCHLLYGIDDGSKTIEESIQLLKDAEKKGIDEMILTPHYVNHSKYMCNNEEKNKIFKKLVNRAKKEGIKIKLYLGNEIFFSSHLLEFIKNKEVQTLNKSKYVLFEFPVNNVLHNTNEIISEMVSSGYVPVLAHPERYRLLQSHPDVAEEYLRCGMLLQGNWESLFGKYGFKAKKTLKYYLKRKWITFLGSDAHHDYNLDEKKLYKKVLRLSRDKEYTDNLLYNNFSKVINDEEIEMIR